MCKLGVLPIDDFNANSCKLQRWWRSMSYVVELLQEAVHGHGNAFQ
jgi:hypothetical protein